VYSRIIFGIQAGLKDVPYMMHNDLTSLQTQEHVMELSVLSLARLHYVTLFTFLCIGEKGGRNTNSTEQNKANIYAYHMVKNI